MIEITTELPTINLPIKKVLAQLFQAYIYTALDDIEHEGYRHPNGKRFKSMNFKISYRGNRIEAKFVALDPKNEEKLAQHALYNFKLGDLKLNRTSISIKNRNYNISSYIKVGGFISINTKDKTSKNGKRYLEPKDSEFIEKLQINTIQKYETLFKKPYMGELKIELLDQKPKPIFSYYKKGAIKVWYGVYRIKGEKEILEMILNTGMGANCMKGVGFVELFESGGAKTPTY